MSYTPAQKKGCSQKRWQREVARIAAEYNIDVRSVLDRNRHIPYTKIRWEAWRSLAAEGFSMASLGTASGFHHTTIMHAINTARDPWKCGNGARQYRQRTPQFPASNDTGPEAA